MTSQSAAAVQDAKFLSKISNARMSAVDIGVIDSIPDDWTVAWRWVEIYKNAEKNV